MTRDEFERADPESMAGPLQALWFTGRGDWERAHTVAQEVEGPDGAWVHAYLHRIEGDLPNAAYWYRRAGRPMATGDPTAEWEAIVTALLGSQDSRSSRDRPGLA